MSTPTSIDDLKYARGPERSAFGQLDDNIEVRMPAQVVASLRRKAHEGGMDLSELIRENLYVLAYGVEHVLSVRQGRTLHASGNAGQNLAEIFTTVKYRGEGQ